MADFGSDLVAKLATSESGIGLIYRALDAVVRHFGLRDAAVVVDEAGLGRQVFRAGRHPRDDEGRLRLAGTGFYTDPPLDSSSFDGHLITNLAVLALRLDLLRYEAGHDPLTGLYDRRSFDRLLENAIARSCRYGWQFTLVILDVDGLKALNDRDGHAAGDAALRALADRLGHVLRYGDDAARIGGDEFGLILPDTSATNVPGILARVREAGAPECDTGLAFSYGHALCPREADELGALFRLADQRLYAAKGRRTDRSDGC
jgi:diguanylate cyclase (GGDEF)-like protein